MARSKEFDPQQALDKAMHLFWAQGYEATSIGDLVEATGVQRYGLYSTFGDKHTLFLQTIDHYQETMVREMVGKLASAEASWAEIKGFFDRLMMMSTNPIGQRGCLVCNSATELAFHDAEVAGKMANYKQFIATVFEQAVTNAQARNELGIQVTPAAAAGYLLGTVLGLFTLVKSQTPLAELQNYVSIALDGLQALAQN